VAGENYVAIVFVASWLVCANGLAAEPWELPSQKYPIVTPSMQPAIIELDAKLDYQPLASVAIVGVDEISARWLELNNEYLLSIGCVGLVVNAVSKEQVEVLKTYTAIPLFPLSVTEHFMEFGGFYPLLIDRSVGRVRQ